MTPRLRHRVAARATRVAFRVLRIPLTVVQGCVWGVVIMAVYVGMVVKTRRTRREARERRKA